jgi:antagonist of KipI
MAALTIVKPGMLTTVQDLGRWGFQASGVPVAGPMDALSHRLANRAVGNNDAEATLEVTLIGPEVVFEEEAIAAVCGARFALTLDDHPVEIGRAFEARAGSRLRFDARSSGARAYLAVAGGLAVQPVFGSRATSLASGMGPLGGRALAAGDRVPIADDRPRRLAEVNAQCRMPNAQSADSVTQTLWAVGIGHWALPSGGARLRVMWGPQEHSFTDAARETLTSARYAITPQSNRMGYRLQGPSLRHRSSADILSDATPIGTLQVPASGQPILLMADRQTAGGYPKIATVITADLPLAGQLAPGDWIEFAPCTRDEAIAALRDQEARLSGLR